MASTLLASFNTLPLDNLNPELPNADMGGIGKLGVVMFSLDGM